MPYLKSNGVKGVYPTAYRDATYDANSDNTTEHNLTTSVNNIGHRNYVVFYRPGATSGEPALRVVLGGYTFDILKGEGGLQLLQNNTAHTDIYLYTRVLSATGTDYTFAQLLEADGDGQDMAPLDVSGEFCGLGYSYGSLPSGIFPTYSLKVFTWVDGVWTVPSTSYGIIDKYLVVNNPNTTIDEQFNTKNLRVSTNTELTGPVTINNQTNGFKITGGTSSNKYLDIKDDVYFLKPVLSYASLQFGNSWVTPGDTITLKQNNNKALTIAGSKSSAQSITFSGDSTFQAGDYSSSSTTSGGLVTDKIKVGGNEFDVVTRGTAQTISGKKTLTGDVVIKGANSSHLRLENAGNTNGTSFVTTTATANRNITIPDKTGTMILSGDVTSAPSATATVASSTHTHTITRTTKYLSVSESHSSDNTGANSGSAVKAITSQTKTTTDAAPNSHTHTYDKTTGITLTANDATATGRIQYVQGISNTEASASGTTTAVIFTSFEDGILTINSDTVVTGVTGGTTTATTKYLSAAPSNTSDNSGTNSGSAVKAITSITNTTTDAAPNAHNHSYQKTTGVSLTENDATATGRIEYIKSVTTPTGTPSATATVASSTHTHTN